MKDENVRIFGLTSNPILTLKSVLLSFLAKISILRSLIRITTPNFSLVTPVGSVPIGKFKINMEIPMPAVQQMSHCIK